jgi:hypothetical protein
MSRILGHVGYGRVRRPKNILGADGTTINAATGQPLDDNATLTDDQTETITGVSSLTSNVLTFTVASTTGIAAGDVIQLAGVPQVLQNRPFSVFAIDAGASVSIRLDLDAAHSIRSTADVVLSPSAEIRRRTTDGYRTENAKFLHLFMDADAAGTTVNFTVHAYNYAFGKWEVLQLPLGRPAQADTALEAVTVTSVHVDTIFSVANGAQRMVIIPIEGVDRVAFTSDADDKSTVTLGAAISTI